MKIGLYSPYLPKHAGGGEKHMLTTAWYLSQNHDVSILIPYSAPNINSQSREYERLFGLDLSKVTWTPSALASGKGNPLTRWKETAGYDVFWYATDGSVFFCGAKKPVLHIQIPFTNRHSGWLGRQKLLTWKVRNANSVFTQHVVQQAWQVKIPFIHYPYVDTARIKPPDLGQKKNNILAVGRFFDPQHTDVHAKRQDVLVETFLTAYQKFGWHKNRVTLTLVGGVEPGSVHADFVRRLKTQAKGYPITFLHDVSYNKLHQLYDQSLIFWHGAGYGIDQEAQPQRVEHFGMSTIEAMAHSAIAVVMDRGGLRESVDHGQNGFRFETTSDLAELTNQVLKMNAKKREMLARAAREKAEAFSLERFCQTIDQMIEA